MTFRRPKPLEPWIALEDFLLKPRGERFKYVRTNLRNTNANSRKDYMSHEQIAAIAGVSSKRPIAWEKGAAPEAGAANKIAALTPYPPESLGGDAEAELVRATFADRLQGVVAQADRNRETIERILKALDDAGIEVPAAA